MRGKLKPWLFAISLALSAEVASAAGFGRINVSSALGQPLAAEIDLLNVSSEDLVGMTVRLASADAFKEANVDMSPALNTVRFSIEKRANGQPFIRVTSSQAISEPALNLLVEVNWPSGRLLRDYPVLLNPAGYAQDRLAADTAPRQAPNLPEVAAKAAPAPDRPLAAPAQTAAAPAASNAAGGAQRAASAASGSAATGAGAGKDSYTIKPGDTLRAIAAANHPASASLEQTMIAMFEANHAVFISENINRIRAGKRLRLPTSEEAKAVSVEEASRRLSLMANDFEAYRKRLADASSARPGAPSGDKLPVTGKLTASTEDAATPAKPGGDVLQVSRSGAKLAQAGQAVRKSANDDRANLLEEEAVARENQLKEAKDRVNLLEGNLTRMRKLLNDKGAAPAQPAAPGEKTAPAPTPRATIPSPVNAPEVLKPVAPVVAAATAEKVKPDVVADAKPADGKTVDNTPPDAKVDDKSTPQAKAASGKSAQSESFMDDVLTQLSDNPLALGGGVLSGLLVGWLGINTLRRRRERTQDLFAPSTSTPEPITVDAVTSDKASALVDTTNASFPSEFERTVPEHQVDEVDPVAEADVYIAYGRDVQAEEILKEAMAKDPDRTEILMKLLEIYAQRKSVDEYSQHALQLRDRVGTDHPLWSAAMAMGYEIDPENPLYNDAGAVHVSSFAAPAAARESLDLDLGEAPHEIHAPGQETPAHVSLDEPHEPASGHYADEDIELHDPHAEQEASETLRALTAISEESLRTSNPDAGAASLWPTLPDVASPGALPLAANAEHASRFADDAFSLDFDLGEKLTPVSTLSHKLESGNAALALGNIDLDLNPEPVAPSSPPILTLVPPSIATLLPVPGESSEEPTSFADIKLDLAETPHEGEPKPEEHTDQWHNVATKLDLARAYLEIGDKDGAREILREVVEEGDEPQRAEASRLTAQI